MVVENYIKCWLLSFKACYHFEVICFQSILWKRKLHFVGFYVSQSEIYLGACFLWSLVVKYSVEATELLKSCLKLLIILFLKLFLVLHVTRMTKNLQNMLFWCVHIIPNTKKKLQSNPCRRFYLVFLFKQKSSILLHYVFWSRYVLMWSLALIMF